VSTPPSSSTTTTSSVHVSSTASASFLHTKIPGIDYDIIYNNAYQFFIHLLNIVEFFIIGALIWCKTKLKEFVSEKLFGKKKNDLLPTTDDFHSVHSF
jgi:hypothetical protein